MNPVCKIINCDETRKIFWRILRTVAKDYGVEVDAEKCRWVGTDETHRADIINETMRMLQGQDRFA